MMFKLFPLKVIVLWSNFFPSIGKTKFIILSAAIVMLIYNELLCYTILYRNWSKFYSSRNSVKILFVADPQLIGLNNEPWWLNPISRWDSDRYLAKGFGLALNHAQPDAVVFLGDIFDEGSSSTNLQYESYINRFKQIFQIPQHIERIFVPGDNDIVIEHVGIVNQTLVERFKYSFPSLNPVTSIGFIDVLKFTGYGMIFDEDFNFTNIAKRSHGKFKILCNHFNMDHALKDIKNIIQPHLVVYGHDHESIYQYCVDCQSDKRKLFYGRLEQQGDFLNINISLGLNTRIEQIGVPSCNYRMGFPNMGYGFMTIDYLGEMNYTVFWLPSRYKILYSYVWFCFTSLIICLICKVRSIRKKHF